MFKGKHILSFVMNRKMIQSGGVENFQSTSPKLFSFMVWGIVSIPFLAIVSVFFLDSAFFKNYFFVFNLFVIYMVIQTSVLYFRPFTESELKEFALSLNLHELNILIDNVKFFAFSDSYVKPQVAYHLSYAFLAIVLFLFGFSNIVFSFFGFVALIAFNVFAFTDKKRKRLLKKYLPLLDEIYRKSYDE